MPGFLALVENLPYQKYQRPRILVLWQVSHKLINVEVVMRHVVRKNFSKRIRKPPCLLETFLFYSNLYSHFLFDRNWFGHVLNRLKLHNNWIVTVWPVENQFWPKMHSAHRAPHCIQMKQQRCIKANYFDEAEFSNWKFEFDGLEFWSISNLIFAGSHRSQSVKKSSSH